MSDKLESAIELIDELTEEAFSVLPECASQRLKAVVELRKTLNAESDRGCALMAAAFIDERLGELLKSYLIEDSKLTKSLLDFNGPFGSFSSRIETSYALGLIPNNVRQDINLLRKIRNDFAHVSKPLTFDDKPISSRCNALCLYGKGNTLRTRGKFTCSMMAAMGVIEVSIMTVDRRKKMPDHDISLNQIGIDFLRKTLTENGHSDLVNAAMR